MADVRSIDGRLDDLSRQERDTRRSSRRVAEPPSGGDDGGMEQRFANIEASLRQVQTDVAVMKSNSATKEDLHRELHATTWKIVVGIVLAQLLPALPSMLRAFKLIA